MWRQVFERFGRNEKTGVNLVTLARDGLSRPFIPAHQSIPNLVDTASQRRNPARARNAQSHAGFFRIRIDALVPPNPNEFERTMSIFASRDLFATISMSRSGSVARKLMFGGRNCPCSASKQMTASIAPAAPNEWPIMLLVELTGTRLNNSTIALPSAASLKGVAVPCALM